MKERKYRYAELGMLLGIFAGGGLATILFATTGNAAYFTIVGIGLALGLVLGAAYDRSQNFKQKSSLDPKEKD